MIVMRGIVSFVFVACCASACGGMESWRWASTDRTASEETAEAVLAVSTEGVCWKRTTVRGAGTVPSECPGAEKSGALCYPFCASGYTGVGPVCWQSCPGGYTDDGAFCRRDAHITSADNSACPWFDKCGLTFARGCTKCPAGYANDGCTCRIDAHIFAKSTQTRGAGWPMSCREGYEDDAGLCYPPCGQTMTGVGPVCWAGCAGDFPVECGAGCARSSDACAEATSNQVLKPTETVVKLVLEDWAGALEAGIAAANTYALPLCGER